MKEEPELIVWLPTLHRFVTAETGNYKQHTLQSIIIFSQLSMKQSVPAARAIL